MASKADIQYVHHYYTAGSAAKKVAVKAEPKKKPLPLFEPLMMAEPDQKVVVKIDPLSALATVVAVALVIMMVVSLFQYSAAHQRNVELQEYVYILSDENIRLEQISGMSAEEAKNILVENMKAEAKAEADAYISETIEEYCA